MYFFGNIFTVPKKFLQTTALFLCQNQQQQLFDELNCSGDLGIAGDSRSNSPG